MKKKNKGITLIKLIVILLIIFVAVITFIIHFDNISQRMDYFFKSIKREINVDEKIREDEKLIGLTDVSGEGIVIDILDGKDLIHQEDLIILIDELKNSGSQAISINEQRITNTTYLYCDGAVILIDGVKIGNPFKIKAIGNKETIYGALKRNKGYLETLNRDGIEITVEKSDNVEIAKTNKAALLKYNDMGNSIDKLLKLDRIAGKLSTRGEGVKITIYETKSRLTALSFLQIVNDLNSAGVEAISINGYRVTNMTDIMDISKTYVLINSIPIKGPFEINAIGDQDKIEEVLGYNNSYVSKTREKGNGVDIQRFGLLKVDEYVQKKDQDKMLINYLK